MTSSPFSRLESLDFTSRIRLADLIEIIVLANPTRPHSRKRLAEMVESHWQVEEGQVSFAMTEMQRRRKSVGNSYPFDVSDTRVLPLDLPSVYPHLLVLSLLGGTLEGDDTAKAFEDISEYCMQDFFGEGTESVNFGWSSEGRPADFGQAIDWLAQKIGIQSGMAYRRPQRKDGGVDLIVWRSFGDRRAGIPIVLVQATLQTDLRAKSRDINTRNWSGWLSMDVDPMTALTSPHVLEYNEEWNEITRSCLLLDRIRLARMSKLEFKPSEQDSFRLSAFLEHLVGL